MSDVSANPPTDDPQSAAVATGTVAAVPSIVEGGAPQPEQATGAVYPSADAAGFGPLEDPPRVEGVELIGEPPDAEANLALESDGSVSIPEEEQVGFVLPLELMQRAEQIGEETAQIAAQVLQIEKVNEVAEGAMSAESADLGAEQKES